MADGSLAQNQRWQSAHITREILRQSGEQEQMILDRARQASRETHLLLLDILRTLAPGVEEAQRSAGRELAALSVCELSDLIHGCIKKLVPTPSRGEHQAEKPHPTQELEELRSVCGRLQKTISELTEQNTKLRAERDTLEAHLSALRQVGGGSPPAAKSEEGNWQASGEGQVGQVMPGWFRRWQADQHFESMSVAVRILGSTGVPMRSSIQRDLAARLGISPANNRLNETFQQLLEYGCSDVPVLMERIHNGEKLKDGAGGFVSMLLRLTGAGRIAYRLLTGREAGENLYDLLIRCHASPGHTVLNIQAMEFLQGEGFQVLGLGQKIQLSSGETYIPDITARDPQSGVTIFIEVERAGNKDLPFRKQKWMKVFEASGGKLFVFCDNAGCQKSVCAEINHALGELEFECRMTNLYALRAGKRCLTDGSIWISQKKTR